MSISRATFVREQNIGTEAAPTWVGTTALEARRGLAGLYAENSPGVPRSGVINPSMTFIVQATDSMTYDVYPCELVIFRAANEGVYNPTLQNITTLPAAVAPGAGLSRYDIIYAKQNDIDKSDADNQPILGVVSGTPSSNPARPSLPAGAIGLAEARIYGGTTSTLQSPNVVTQTYRFTAPRGGLIQCRTLAERNEITLPARGQMVLRMDRNNHVQMYVGPTQAQNTSGWKYITPPERYIANASTFVSTESNQARVITTLDDGIPTRPYASRIRVYGQAAIRSDPITTGVLRLIFSASAGVGTADAAQAKSWISFSSPGDYLQSVSASFDWITLAANQNPLARLWIDYDAPVSTVNHQIGNNPNSGYIEALVMPADD
ncbi:minor tail protein [Arthrobacter phage Shambre1]|uniref:Minor tail protein n=1 Tax=Arthrobacter phage Shambre1 TaxID=2927284 RepID=A0A977KNK7_9CAUD|nr:minor tail protein [Arthrobacter phage Shambre1]UXE04759.1 minor tail protein [Arthrobacter phage Shambre1]